MKKLLYIIIDVVLLMACSERQEYVGMLERAKALMHDEPDSALMIIDSLGQHEAEFGKSFRMRYRMYRLNALNKVDTLFRSTDEAKELAEYFDDHGTPNEQMLAYYLLGRAYYDIHEAPMALNYFQTASERADTTAIDCDYRQLSRVYGQMSEIFYYQGLYQQELEYEDLSVNYGWKGNAPLIALRSMGGKILAYKLMNNPDSAIKICEDVFALLKKHGYKDYAASYLSSIIHELLDQNEIEKAERYIRIYEGESGYFDSNNNIEKGRESYYYSKGLYYMAVEKYDSAEYVFRKELREGKDFNNQNAGSRGLALLFQKIHQSDSAAKYALYSYAMNDSVYAQRAMKEVEQMQGMYDYSRNQELARQSKEKADKARARAQLISIALFLILVIVAIVAREVHKKRKAERLEYKNNVSLLAKTQADVIKLRSYGTELNQMLDDKEKETARLTTEIERYKERVGLQKESADALLEKSETYQYLKKSASKAVVLSDEDWHQAHMMIIEVLPNFYKLISSKRSELNDNEFRTSILIRLHFTPKEIANMLDVTQPYITKVCRSLMLKLFDEEGKSKDLSERLKLYS
jgi:tetratricopeptide (TPR) repeat protein